MVLLPGQPGLPLPRFLPSLPMPTLTPFSLLSWGNFSANSPLSPYPLPDLPNGVQMVLPQNKMSTSLFWSMEALGLFLKCPLKS